MGEIGALLLKNGEAAAIALGVSGRASRAVGFFAGVIDLQRQDRKPVDDQAGRFGVEGRVFSGQVLGREPVEQGAVEVFGKIVAELIGAVDAPLDVGELGVGGAAGCGPRLRCARGRSWRDAGERRAGQSAESAQGIHFGTAQMLSATALVHAIVQIFTIASGRKHALAPSRMP